MNIIDFHCDYLLYAVTDEKRGPFDPAVRCSYPQLKRGGVSVQTMAAFTFTARGSAASGSSQSAIYSELPKKHETLFRHVKTKEELAIQSEQVGLLFAYENASSFSEEGEKLDVGLKRLSSGPKPIYISLTWNEENRFGGGNLSKVGLKEDGKRLLDFLDGKRIGVDFSHTSDPLAYGILEYVDQKGLDIPVMASHSNYRYVADFQRNLPDDLAKELVRRGGVIGFNLIRYMVGAADTKFLAKQLEHAITIVGIEGIALGADFFCIEDAPENFRKPEDVLYFPEFNSAETYPKLFSLWHKELNLSKQDARKIAHSNAVRFLTQKIF